MDDDDDDGDMDDFKPEEKVLSGHTVAWHLIMKAHSKWNQLYSKELDSSSIKIPISDFFIRIKKLSFMLSWWNRELSGHIKVRGGSQHSKPIMEPKTIFRSKPKFIIP
jgi:hypothetical protein